MSKRYYEVGGEVFDSSKDYAIVDVDDLVDLLNEQDKRIKEQQIIINNISDQRNELYHRARENAQEIRRLEKRIQALKWENNNLKCALAVDSVEYIIADGKKIDIPPYYEFENCYKIKKVRREEYDEYW